MYFTFYFGTFFSANIQPVFLCFAGNTYPKAPDPRHLPSSKSLNDNPGVRIFLLEALRERPKVPADKEGQNSFFEYDKPYSKLICLLGDLKVLLRLLLLL